VRKAVIASEEMIERRIRTALFNPLLASLADMQRGIGRLAEQRIARRLVGSAAEPTFSHEGCDGRVNPSNLAESGA
jgi:hypothetical protein